MKPGNQLSFRLRLMVRAGDWYSSYRHIAEQIYGFRDYRENLGGSLNDTLENMVAYGMDDIYSGWVEDLKGFDYSTDVGGTVKVVSALHPLSVALLTDSREVFRRRALPITEYLMSREKYLFSTATGITHQNPSHYLKGPAAEVSELAAIYSISGGRSTVFRHYANVLNTKPRALNLLMVSEGGSWQNELALYRMSGDKAHLDKARAGADRYIAERIAKLPTDFTDVRVETGGQFWSDFAPKWIDLFELFEETQDRRYLDAAAAGARDYVTYTWMHPVIPDADVTVNFGNQVGIHNGMPFERTMPQMRAMEEKVPAWRVSWNGLVPEAANTFTGNPAVFLAHHAAYMLRIGTAIKDPLLTAAARSAIIGRYTNFPGYDINGEFTTVYQRPDYPLRPFKELSYNQIYYNHIWPHIALLYDFLISDVITKSAGQIHFPSQYAQGYAYLQSKTYGDRPGVFYGNKDVRLWMPAKLLRIDNPQVNYVSAYDRKSLYVAFSNQSKRPVTTRVFLNSTLASYSTREQYNVRVWPSAPGEPVKMREGMLEVTIPASGLKSVAIDGVRVLTSFQGEVFGEATPLSERSLNEADTPIGRVTGMILSFGAPNTSAYIWINSTTGELKSAKLYYRTACAAPWPQCLESEWKAAEDTRYPYEFSLPIAPEVGSVEYFIEGTLPDGSVRKSTPVELKK
jgi:hypothetical protein